MGGFIAGFIIVLSCLDKQGLDCAAQSATTDKITVTSWFESQVLSETALINSGGSSPSYYGKYRPSSDNPNPVMKDVIESQDVFIELDKSGIIFYHAAMSGYPTIENTGNYTVKDGEIIIEWANGKLPIILYLEKSGETYTITLSGNIYKKEAD